MRSLYERLLNNSDAAADDESNWMLTMSDVMSLLLVFLIMFFIMTKKNVGPDASARSQAGSTAVHAEEIKPVREIIKVEPYGVEEKIRDEIITGIRSFNLDDELYVDVRNREVIITMKEKITFRPGDAVILPGTLPVLDNIAGIISRYPEFLVEIAGHTDNVPINTPLYPSNWELSAARATSVLKYFITKHEIDPSRFSVRGNAYVRPVAPNDTAGNRAQNRRVEIRLKGIES